MVSVKQHSLETAPEKELDTGPEKDDAPPKGVMADEPPNGVRLWLKLGAPEAAEEEGGGFCCSWVGSGP